MAIENTYLTGAGIVVAGGFDLQAKTPLDSRQTVPKYAGLAALVAGNACYAGMIVYVEDNKKTYQYTGDKWEELIFTDTIPKDIEGNAATASSVEWGNIKNKPQKFEANITVEGKTLIFN